MGTLQMTGLLNLNVAKFSHKLKQALIPGGPMPRKLLRGPAAGCVMEIDLHHQLSFYLGIYEAELVPHLKELIRPGAGCFDVGGQGGYDALIMAKASSGPVISFECDSTAAATMRDTFSRNPTYRIRTVETFVGRIDDVRHMTLDSAAQEFFMPDFIKLDIEGSEDEALDGAACVLSQRKPSLIVEVHSLSKEERCLEILRSHGYSPLIVNQRRWLKEHRPLSHNRWLVCRGV
jgi:Methyltransferase FkbM domain